MRFLLSFFVLSFFIAAAYAQGVPTSITYQGKLTDLQGRAVSDGAWSMRLKLFDAQSAGNQLWDSGTLSVTTSAGVFTVVLQPIDSTTLGQGAVWIEVKVASDPPLPRSQLTSAPYALRAGSIALPFQAAASSSSPGVSISQSGTGTGVQVVSAGTGVYAGSYATGGTGLRAVSNFGSTAYGVWGSSDAGLGGFFTGYVCGARATSNYGNGVEGTTGEHSKSGVYGYSPIGKGVSGYTDTTDVWVPAVYAENRGWGDGVYGFSTRHHGAVGFTDSTYSANAGVWGESNYGYGVHGKGVIGVRGEASTGNGVVGEAYNADASGVYGHNSAGAGVSGYSDGSDGVVGWTGAAYKSGVYGAGSIGYGVVGRSGGNDGIAAFTSSTNPGNAALRALNQGTGLGIYAEGGGTSPAAIFSGNVQVRAKATGTTVLELGEGLDYAEGFDLSSDAAPGTVLVIDPEHPGKLAVSARAYNKRVAGIVAGARGLGSGVRLGSDKFEHSVALAGRVYCNVDASYGAVVPGDLLTTSPTRGCAMRVRDHARAQGAILGKAMQRLAKGSRGQILVLVTLQ